jgi:hypothetical protein
MRGCSGKNCHGLLAVDAHLLAGLRVLSRAWPKPRRAGEQVAPRDYCVAVRLR